MKDVQKHPAGDDDEEGGGPMVGTVLNAGKGGAQAAPKFEAFKG